MTVNGPGGRGLPDWDAINWRVHEGNVRRLRRRIFKATREQDWARVRSLQKMMLRSWSNTLVSVRQVTQRNAGRRTPGVDGQVALSSKARAEMAVLGAPDDLLLGARAGPARVCTEGQWKTPPARHSRAGGPLPPGTGPSRAGTRVGGPVRAQSYGFRPGRGCADAIASLFTTLKGESKRVWIVDADLSAAFDRIDHSRLLAALGSFPARDMIAGWLKAGVIEDGASPRPRREPLKAV